MAHEFNLDINNVAIITAKLVGADFNLASLISSDVAAEFHPGQGATVRVPVPAAIPTRSKNIFDKTTALVADELTEQHIDVTLADHLYNLAILSEGDLSLNIANYGRQVLAPQARAIAAKIEALTAATMSATPAEPGVTYIDTNPAKAISSARRILRSNGVGADAPLIAAAGASVYTDLLDAGALIDDKVHGIRVVESTRLAESDLIVFTPSAFTLVVRAPVVPQGAAYGASITTPILDNANGKAFAIRVLNDYDSNVAADRSLVGTFAAVASMPLPVDREDGTVDLVKHGGAVRITSSA